MPNGKMAKELITFCIVLAVQAISAYELSVPVSSQPGTRIVGGKTAAKGQFPHQAAILLDYSSFCGGSLISKTWVLTAGHCVSRHLEWAIELGAHDLREIYEPGRVSLTSRKGITHEDYNLVGLFNDIGLIALPEEVKLTDTVNIIPLPPRSYQNENFVGRSVRVSGWGRTSDDATKRSPILKFVDLTLISLDECRKSYGDHITKSKYCCSGANKKSTCGGDSGGAMTIGSGKNLTHLGIVSFVSRSGCEEGKPAGFTATTFFVDWISTKTGIPVQDF